MTRPGREFVAKHENLSLGLSIHLKSQSGPCCLLITPALLDWWGQEGHRAGYGCQPGSWFSERHIRQNMTEQDAQHGPLASGHAHTHAYTTCAHVRVLTHMYM